MKIKLLLLCMLVLSPTLAFADGYHWIHPSGASAWATCRTATAVDPGSNYCAYSTANINADAGDTVYVKGGTYLTYGGNDHNAGIAPERDGTSGSKITYVNVPGETPVFSSPFVFTITAANATAGATYTNNGLTFTVVTTISAGESLTASGTGAGIPSSSGTLTKASGTGDDSITFASFNRSFAPGITLIKDYIKVDGMIFRDVYSWGYITGDYNEITNSIFSATSEATSTQGGFSITGSHNWMHNNIMNTEVSSGGPCTEAVDLIRIGGGYSIGNVAPTANNNTIEDNLLYHTAHTIIDNFGMYNVIRNNIMHNEPWIAGCTASTPAVPSWREQVSASLEIKPGSTGSFTSITGMGNLTSTTNMMTLVSRANKDNAMGGTITAYNTATGATTLNIAASGVSGSGTHSDWDMIVNTNYPHYDDTSFDGKFGHRNLQLSDDFARDGTFVLVEGNRMGHASNNPGNNGPMNMDCAAPKNIVRYNALYNGMSAGIYFKYANADFQSPITATDTITLETGEKTFNIQTGLHLSAGQTFRAWSQADHTKAVTGTVTSYSDVTGALVTSVTEVHGSGDVSDWQVFWNGASGGQNNRIFNNTIYHNGHGYEWNVYSAKNNAINRLGIAQVNGAVHGSTANVIKNNIVYDNHDGAICGSSTEGCSAAAYDTVANNLLTNPNFTDPDLTAPTSQNLFSGAGGYAATPLPDLTLQAGSGAIDTGTYLTTVHADDTSSGTSLIVTDSLYFQAGSAAATTPMGSVLSGIAGDYIKVGATLAAAEEVQITDINYTNNTLTINPAITRADGEYIWLSRRSDGTVVLIGNAPDMGAYESNEEGDTTAPTVTAFTIPASGTSTTITISSMTCTDAVGVTGYCVTSTNSSTGCSWSGSAPASVTVASDGAWTLYGWCKDAAGNVSSSVSDSVQVTLPTAAATLGGSASMTISRDGGAGGSATIAR